MYTPQGLVPGTRYIDEAYRALLADEASLHDAEDALTGAGGLDRCARLAARVRESRAVLCTLVESFLLPCADRVEVTADEREMLSHFVRHPHSESERRVAAALRVARLVDGPGTASPAASA